MSNLINRFRRWWLGISRRDEFRGLNESEIVRIAGDVGVSVGELRELSRLGPDAAEQLSRRLQALGWAPEELATARLSEFRDMQRLCALCQSKGQCAQDLSHDPLSADWSSYCPNASAIRALKAARGVIVAT
jgi:hypothetical protein